MHNIPCNYTQKCTVYIALNAIIPMGHKKTPNLGVYVQ